PRWLTWRGFFLVPDCRAASLRRRMKISFSRHAPARLAVALLCAPLLRAGGELAHGERGIVATVHPLATDAAVETLKNGGNAIDAAVAAALTLGIVDGPNSGIGGGCFMLIR